MFIKLKVFQSAQKRTGDRKRQKRGFITENTAVLLSYTFSFNRTVMSDTTVNRTTMFQTNPPEAGTAVWQKECKNRKFHFGKFTSHQVNFFTSTSTVTSAAVIYLTAGIDDCNACVTHLWQQWTSGPPPATERPKAAPFRFRKKNVQPLWSERKWEK